VVIVELYESAQGRVRGEIVETFLPDDIKTLYKQSEWLVYRFCLHRKQQIFFRLPRPMSEAVPLLDPRSEDGLPQRSDLAKIPGRVLLFYATLNSIFLGIGVGSACLIDRYLPDSKVESKIRLLADYDLGWLYLAVFLLKFVPNAINAVVAARRKEARANNPDQHVYRVYTAPGAPALPYVLMETEGDVGRFNRAQRFFFAMPNI